MKKNILYNVAVLGLVSLGLASCNDYLDKLPDDRAELTTTAKVTNLVVSAYPQVCFNLLMETCTDNVTDNGRQYSPTQSMKEAYQFKVITSEGNDDPKQIWGGFYESVATCNLAIEAAEQLDPSSDSQLQADIAEAKIIRAYSMFQMAQMFCMPWCEENANQLGLCYPKTSATKIEDAHPRGTLAELYQNIDADIQAALPNIGDNYSVPKYHFTKQAAYAFASRFYLVYNDMDKAIEYATKALGDSPSSFLRDLSQYTELGRTDIGDAYIRSSEPANILLIASYSTAGAYLCWGAAPRFNHNSYVCSYETYWADGVWGSGSSSNFLYWANMLYGSNQCVAFPKFEAQFEYTDKIQGIGYYRAVNTACTGDETLMTRAEAYARKGMYDEAIADMNLWMTTHCKDSIEDSKGNVTYRPVLGWKDGVTSRGDSVVNVCKWMEEIDYCPSVPESWRDHTVRKEFHPLGFTIEAGTMEDLIQVILQMRRLDCMYDGTRFTDLKRYGISYAHNVSGEDPIVFQRNDIRGVFQIPNDVLIAGVEPNPRPADEK